MTSEYSKVGRFSSLQSNLFGDFSEFDLITKDNAKKISDNTNIIIEKFGILNGSLDENKTKLQTTFGEVGENALAKFYNVIKESDLNENSLNSESAYISTFNSGLLKEINRSFVISY